MVGEATNVYLGGTRVDGAFEVVMDEQGPGSRSQLSLYTETEHRMYYQVVRTLLRVFIHTDRVEGVLWPRASGELSLSRGGREQGSTKVVADGSGLFAGRLKAASGQAAAIAPGDRVERSGADAAGVTVQPLDFDFSPTEGIRGQVPAGGRIRIELGLSDDVTIRTERIADDMGRVGFGQSDVGVRDRWGLADIKWIRLTLNTVDGHEIVREANIEPDVPHPSRNLIYLPWAVGGKVR